MNGNSSADATPDLGGGERATIARNRREEAVRMAFDPIQRPIPAARSNGDNATYKSLPMAFAKGLLHDAYGVVDPAGVKALAKALTSVGGLADKPDSAFAIDTPTETFTAATAFEKWKEAGFPKAGRFVSCRKKNEDGKAEDWKDVKFRGWESPLAGLYYTDEGPDPAGVGMAPAPKLGSSELIAEMAELYAMAIVRDIPFAALANPATPLTYIDARNAGAKDQTVTYKTAAGNDATVQDLVDALNQLAWFSNGPMIPPMLSMHERYRHDARFGPGQSTLDVASLFRGSAPGSKSGDYLSRFLTGGTHGMPGVVRFGAQTISQSVLVAQPGIDYMTSWAEWVDVQNGLDLKGTDAFVPNAQRVIETPRDLATYVHLDQLYQAYFNACLMLLEGRAPFDRGLPDQRGYRTREPFATFGGPHILSLMTEVASRALKAVRRQKFQVHRRARPERLAALLALADGKHADKLGDAQGAVATMRAALGGGPRIADLMTWVKTYNAVQNDPAIQKRRGYVCEMLADKPAIDPSLLLPMAFPEGSPMHPAYGAGHATVAGACVTILKAFFEMSDAAGPGADTHKALVDQRLATMERISGEAGLTLEGELNKLAANIAIGRNFAGVHYYSDYYDSLRLGERVAFGILQEQMLNYNEMVSMTFRSFDGDTITIGTKGGRLASDVTVRITDGSDKEKDVKLSDWWGRHVIAGMTDPAFVDITPVSNWTAAA